MELRYIAALIAFLGGSLISLINAIVTAKQISKDKNNPGNVSFVRQILSIIYLVGTYFVVRKLGIEYFLPLLGAAIGLTVPAVLFAITIANKMKGDD